jgi:hypothetical protein
MRRLLPWVALATVVLALILALVLGTDGGRKASSPTAARGADGVISPPSGRTLPTPHGRIIPSSRLTATVTPAGQVTALSTASGETVTRLHAGWYSLRIAVDSLNANFDLVGPNLHRTSTPRSMDLAIWGIHLVPGTYRYMNDEDPGATSHEISVY